jgi:hypothetical protein
VRAVAGRRFLRKRCYLSSPAVRLTLDSHQWLLVMPTTTSQARCGTWRACGPLPAAQGREHADFIMCLADLVSLGAQLEGGGQVGHVASTGTPLEREGFVARLLRAAQQLPGFTVQVRACAQ